MPLAFSLVWRSQYAFKKKGLRYFFSRINITVEYAMIDFALEVNSLLKPKWGLGGDEAGGAHGAGNSKWTKTKK
jgi:hypothetical protein